MPSDVQEQAGKSAGLSERQSHSIILLRKKAEYRMPYCPRRKRRPAVRNAGRQGSAPMSGNSTRQAGHVGFVRACPGRKLRASEAPAGKSRSSDGVAGDGERQEWREGRVFPVCRLSCLSPGYFAVFPGESCRRRKRAAGSRPPIRNIGRISVCRQVIRSSGKTATAGSLPCRPELCLQKHVFGEKQPAMRNACRSDVRGGLYGNRKGSVFISVRWRERSFLKYSGCLLLFPQNAGFPRTNEERYRNTGSGRASCLLPP